MAAMDNPPLTVVARVDSALAGGPPFGHTAIRMSLNLFVAQAWDRLGNTQKAAAAARRTGGIDQTFSSVQQAANRERGRLLLAVGDTAEAMVIWQAYIKTRNRAEPSQRALDEPIRAKLAELERKKR